MKKIPPLQLLKISAAEAYRQEFLLVLDAIATPINEIELATDAKKRKEAITELREILELARENYRYSSHLMMHEAKTEASLKGGDTTAAFSRAIIRRLERDWDPIPRAERKPHKVWLKENLERILKECAFDEKVNEANVFKQVLRWMNPSGRP